MKRGAIKGGCESCFGTEIRRLDPLCGFIVGMLAWEISRPNFEEQDAIVEGKKVEDYSRQRGL